MPDFSFRKNEKLCSKKVIDRLFAEGKSVFAFPLKFVYLETGLTTATPAQAGFAVSKRNFKKAVQRNLIKRRMREAYRLHKPDFYEALKEKQVAVFFVYTAKDIANYAVIESAIKKGLKKLVREIQTKENNLK
ncbi:MAG TPA: ribonuclease P protein component [Prolixibacteraceae bacterium]|nr:ribonuclease P protein component [Prolixibacteraceae bacterium]